MVKKKKITQYPKCDNEGCEVAVPLAQQLIGKCGRCMRMFCIKHRLPEEHNCISQKCISQEDKDTLADSMRCVAAKI